MVLLANKKDTSKKEREVTKEQGQELAMKNNWTFYEISAKKNDKNCKLAVQTMCERINEMNEQDGADEQS